MPDEDFDYARRAYEWPRRMVDILRDAISKANTEHRCAAGPGSLRGRTGVGEAGQGRAEGLGLGCKRARGQACARGRAPGKMPRRRGATILTMWMLIRSGPGWGDGSRLWTLQGGSSCGLAAGVGCERVGFVHKSEELAVACLL